MEKFSDTRCKIDALVEKNGRYPAAAYEFVADAVQEAVRRLDTPRHVTAAELLGVFRDYAKETFGPMTEFMLGEWGIESAADVGCMVYEMIGAELLSASPEDRESDFDIVFPLTADPMENAGKKSGKRRTGKVPKID